MKKLIILCVIFVSAVSTALSFNDTKKAKIITDTETGETWVECIDDGSNCTVPDEEG